MVSLKGGYHVCARSTDRIASLGVSDHLGVYIAAILPDYGTLHVDAQDFTDSGGPASWLITRDPVLGTPQWHALGSDDAQRRASMHREAEEKYIADVTMSSIAELAGMNEPRREPARRKQHKGVE